MDVVAHRIDRDAEDVGGLLVGPVVDVDEHNAGALHRAQAFKRVADVATNRRLRVGGGAFRASPERAREVGADAWAADMREAIAVARTLGAR